MGTEYKVVELTIVTDETIEKTLNEWTANGWRFDTLQFAMRDSSPRPSMAFAVFHRASGESGSEESDGD